MYAYCIRIYVLLEVHTKNNDSRFSYDKSMLSICKQPTTIIPFRKEKANPLENTKPN